MSATRTAKAWDMIGWDDGTFRILPHGRTKYESVMYNCATARTDKVKIARLGNEGGLHEVRQWVGPDTMLEFDDAEAFDAYVKEMNLTQYMTKEAA